MKLKMLVASTPKELEQLYNEFANEYQIGYSGYAQVPNGYGFWILYIPKPEINLKGLKL